MPYEGDLPGVSRSNIYDMRAQGIRSLSQFGRSSRRSLMSIVGAFDVHRRQLTFDYADTVTGEVRRGRITPADREHLRAWLTRFADMEDVHFALEGCTGWRY